MTGNNGQMHKMYKQIYSLDIPTNIRKEVGAFSIDFYIKPSENEVLAIQKNKEGTESIREIEFTIPVYKITAEQLRSKLKSETKIGDLTTNHEQEIIDAIAAYAEKV